MHTPHPSPRKSSSHASSPLTQEPADGLGREDGAEQQYLAWLARQYAHFQRSLFGLLRRSRPDIVQVSCGLLLPDSVPNSSFPVCCQQVEAGLWPRVRSKRSLADSSLLPNPNTAQCRTLQVAAFSAAMQMVRSERPGGFANQLFGRLLRAALAPDAASGAVVGVLVNKYMACVDVRREAQMSALPSVAVQLRIGVNFALPARIGRRRSFHGCPLHAMHVRLGKKPRVAMP